MADPSTSAVDATTSTTTASCPVISNTIAPRRARRLFTDKVEVPPSEGISECDVNIGKSDNQTMIDTNADDCIEGGDEDRRKIRRGWNVWTVVETRSFFAGLAYHGKDFLAIQSFMQNKGLSDSNKKSKPPTLSSVDGDKRKNSAATPPPLPKESGFKTREQVRHYYYRTWHKISSALSDIAKVTPASVPSSESESENNNNAEVTIDKAVLELYGLINYGEIWKKIGSKFDAKIKSHLRELVLEGVTVIRGLKTNSKSGGSKGIKIKTPSCRALKKINGFTVENDVGSPSLPSMSSISNQSLPEELVIELVPSNNESFVRVQELAQNPRVKTRVRMDRRVSSLCHFLEMKKWNEARFRDSRLNFFAGSNTDENNCDGVDIGSSRRKSGSSHLKKSVKLKLEDSLVIQLDQDIKLAKNNTTSTTTTTTLANYAPPLQVLHFKYYLSNMKSDPKCDKSDLNSAKKKSKPSSDDEGGNKKERILETSELNEESCSSTSSFAPFRETVKKLNQLNEALCSIEEPVEEKRPEPKEAVEDVMSEVQPRPVQDEVSLPPEDVKLSQWLRLKEQRMEMVNDGNCDQAQESMEPSMDMGETKSVTQEFLVEAESIKNGFLSKSGSGITFGELYCLLKYPQKVIFTYEFVKEPRSTFDSIAIEEALVSLAEKKKKLSFVDRLIDSLGVNINLQKKISFGVQNLNSSNLSNGVMMNSNVHSSNQGSVNQSKQINSCTMGGPSPPKMIGQHNFLIPTGPAPRSAIVSNSSECPQPVMGFAPTPILSQFVPNDANIDKRNTNKRQRVVCENPQLVQDAIKELNTNRLPRKRPRSIRPTPVGPVAAKTDLFVSNHNQSGQPAVIVQQPIAPLIDGKQLLISNGSSVYQVVQTPTAAPIQIISSQNSVPAFAVGGLPPTILLTSGLQPVVSNQSMGHANGGVSSNSDAGGQNKVTFDTSTVEVSQQQTMVSESMSNQMNLQSNVNSITSNSTSSQDNFLSSLNDLSLPDLASASSSSMPTVTSASSSGVGVTITTLNNPFIGSENSNSSISEFITFATNNDNRPGDLNVPSGRPPSTTPAWLHDHLTNSNSLGLSNLFELK